MKGSIMRPPNILFVFTDEQRFDTMGAYGNDRIETPNLDKLAAESTVFEQAYVTQPVCTPSRSSIMTGLYPHTNGCTENNVPLPLETPCLPELIAKTPYVTGYHGKWHLGDEIFAQHGFEDWISIDYYTKYYRDWRDKNAKPTYQHWLQDQGIFPQNGDAFGRGEAAHLPEEYSKPAYLGQEGERFIREHRNEPFILFVNFFEPHMPYYGPRDDQYDPAEIPLPENFHELPGDEQPLKTRLFQRAYYEGGHSGLPLKTEADWRRMIANYWGLCSLVDTHFGRILKTLEDCNLMDETIIVYTSDHGDMMGSHRLLAKCVMYEEAARVPLLIRLPGQHKQQRVSTPVSQIDLVPTLLDLIGEDVPYSLDGKSLRPQLEHPHTPNSQDVVFEWNGLNNGFGDVIGKAVVPDAMRELADRDEIEAAIGDPVRTIVTTDNWKFNFSMRGEHELYNLNEDVQETRNLAKDSAYRELMQEMADKLRAWQERTGDTAPACELRN